MISWTFLGQDVMTQVQENISKTNRMIKTMEVNINETTR